MQKEERRKTLIFAEREGGKLIDYTALFSNDYISNWLCKPCFLLLQSCVAAESHFYRCKAKFLRSRNINNVESGDVVHVKHCRPLMESTSSQSTKVPKVSRSPPMQKTVKQMVSLITRTLEKFSVQQPKQCLVNHRFAEASR